MWMPTLSADGRESKIPQTGDVFSVDKWFNYEKRQTANFDPRNTEVVTKP